jgi:hypothetical protein
LGAAVDGSFLSGIFLFELAIGAVIPAVILAVPRLRTSGRWVGAAAVLTVFGIMGYRFNLSIVAFFRPDVMSYFPSLVELGVSVGIVAGAGLLFIFFVENLRVYPEEHWEEVAPEASDFYEPHTARVLLPASLAAPRRYSLAFVVAAAATIALLPEGMLLKPRLLQTPVEGPRVVEGIMQARPNESGFELAMIAANSTPPPEAPRVDLMVIDGNRDGRLVLFPHEHHVAKLGDRQSCETCHHQSLPFSRNSACGQCHRDMYAETDTFVHLSHVTALQGNEGCVRCHGDPAQVKTRDATTRCMECHTDMVATASRIQLPEEGMTGYAAGYMDAMHGLCVKCHEERVEKEPASFDPEFARCSSCHRDADGSGLRQMAPHVMKEIFAGVDARDENG